MTTDAYFEEFGSRLIVARILEHEFARDPETNDFALDKQGNRIPTGRYSVQFLERTGTRNKVFAVTAIAGNSMFVGGLPEIGSLCIVGFRQANQPVILGYLPFGFNNLQTIRGEIPTLHPGEFLLQGSATSDSEELGQTFFRAARVFFDQYQRIIITARGYECIYGPLLENEYTDDVSYLNDPITGNPIWFIERAIGNKIERRWDREGNFSFRTVENQEYRADATYKVTGQDVEINGINTMIWQDIRGNHFSIDDEGQMEIVGFRNFRLAVGSQFKQEVGGNLDRQVGGSHTNFVGDSMTDTVVFNKAEIVGLNRQITVVGQELKTILGAQTHAIQGAKTLSVLGAYTQTITGAKTENISGNKVEAIQGNKTETIQGAKTENVQGASTEAVSGVKTTTVVGDYTLTAPTINLVGQVFVNGIDLGAFLTVTFPTHIHTAPANGGQTSPPF